MTLTKIAARGLWRNRFRTVATVLAVGTAVLTFLLLRTVLTAWATAAEYAPKDRLVTRHKVSFVMPLPHRYVQAVRAMPGVRVASFATWFGGHVPNHEQDMFTTWAVDGNYLQVFDEFQTPAEQWRAWEGDRTGVIVGDALAAKYGWAVGDRVTLESGIFPASPEAPWTFTVRAIYTARSSSVDRSTLLLHWSYLNDAMPESRRDQVGWISTRLRDPGRAAEVAAAIDRTFDSEEIQTQTQDEKSFQASVLAASSAVLNAIGVISLIMLLIMSLVLGNTVVMNVSERIHEFAVLRALGFQPRHLLALVIAESSFVATLGGLLGVALSYPIVERGIGSVVEKNLGSLLPHFKISPVVTLGTITAVVLLGALVALPPAYQTSRLRVSEALRKVS